MTGQVFSSPTIVERNTGFQMFVDPENGDMNTAVLAEGTDLGLEMNDCVHVIGTVKGSLEGENAFGGKVSAVEVDASKVEPVSAVAVVDPTQESVHVGRTLSDQGFSVTLKLQHHCAPYSLPGHTLTSYISCGSGPMGNRCSTPLPIFTTLLLPCLRTSINDPTLRSSRPTDGRPISRTKRYSKICSRSTWYDPTLVRDGDNKLPVRAR